MCSVDQKGGGINLLYPPVSQQSVLSDMDAADTRFAVVTPGSPPRLLSVEKVRDAVCSQKIINRKDMAAVTGPPHHQGSLLQWAGQF